MSVELQTDEGAPRSPGAPGPVGDVGSAGRSRPNVSGDLPTVFQAAPMFRRALAGYDRFQVDTYVQWAEEELATADREREHLLARHLRTQAALDEANRLLQHSAGGGEFLQVSQRIGSMLAAAADEAECMRTQAERMLAEAEADRSAAAADAAKAALRAQRVVAEAEVESERLRAAAAAESERTRAEARRLVDHAEQLGNRVRAEAAARLEEAHAMEARAAEHADQLRQEGRDDASAARLRARDDIVAMLGTGREERRRADAAAAAVREQREREAAVRHASLLTEVDRLERRRAALRAEIERSSAPAVAPDRGWFAGRLRPLLSRFG